MNFTKLKRGIPLALITGILVLPGCQSTEAVQKNKLMTESDTIRSEQISQRITEEQAREIAIKSFEDYFGKKIDVDNLLEDISLSKIGVKYSFDNRARWHVSWKSFDSQKFKDTSSLTKDEMKELIKKLDKESKYATTYYTNIEEKDGKIIDIGIIDINRNKNISKEEFEAKRIKTEEAQNIVLDFIKKNKLVDNIEELEFIGDMRADSDLEGGHIVYKYGENKVINVFLESPSKEISSFAYVDEDWVDQAIAKKEARERHDEEEKDVVEKNDGRERRNTKGEKDVTERSNERERK